MPNGENSPQEVWAARKYHWNNLERAQRPFLRGAGVGPRRHYQWETRAFHRFLIERAPMPFVWGGNDCALFAADGILAITGVDIAGDFRGKYSDEKGAFATITAVCGGTTVADAAAHCAQAHGLVEWTHPLMARRGDLVVIANGGALIAGLVHLNGRHAVSVSESGLVRLPITSVKRAWHYE